MSNTLFNQIWFPRGVQEITIVAPPSYDDLKDADIKSPNYSLLDRLGDRDSVYTMGKLLSRKYPKAKLHLMSSEDIKQTSLSRNFVIIGGSGGRYFDAETKKIEYFQGNELCRIFSEKIRSRVRYSDDCESMVFNSEEYKSVYNAKGYLIKDFGYFATFKNPFYKRARIVLIHGVHTLGVMGAARVFDGDFDSQASFKIMNEILNTNSLNKEIEFESIFEVDVTNGEVECPIINPKSIWNLFANEKPNLQESALLTVNDSKIKEEVVQLIKLAINESETDAKKTALGKLFELIKNWTIKDIENIKSVYNICSRNHTIPDANIRKITKIINQDNDI